MNKQIIDQSNDCFGKEQIERHSSLDRSCKFTSTPIRRQKSEMNVVSQRHSSMLHHDKSAKEKNFMVLKGSQSILNVPKVVKATTDAFHKQIL